MTVAFEHEIPADHRQLIEEILASDIGETSAVDQPATDRNFRLFKSCSCDGGKCGCAGGAGKGVGMRKDDGLVGPPLGGGGAAVAEMEPPDPEALAAQVVEIPAPPKKFGYSDLIRAAMDLGFGETDATALAQLIRKDLGNPDNPEEIFIPKGSSPEAMIAQAAVHGGIAVPAGRQPEVEALVPEPEKRFRFTSKPGMAKAEGVSKEMSDEIGKAPHGAYWRTLFKRFLGHDRPPTEVERLEGQVKQLREGVATIVESNQKSRGDLMEVIRLLARALGMPAEEAAAAIGAAPADGEPALPAAAGGLGGGARAAAGVPGKAVAATKSAEEILAQVQALLASGGASVAAVAGETPVGDPHATAPAVTAPAPAATQAGLEIDPDAVGVRMMDPANSPDLSGIAPATAPEKILPAARKAMEAAAPAAAPGGNGKKYSTMFGAWVSTADRRAVGWKNGVN